MQILNLQLVPALSKDGLGILLKAPREDATLPIADIDSAIWVRNSCREKTRWYGQIGKCRTNYNFAYIKIDCAPHTEGGNTKMAHKAVSEENSLESESGPLVRELESQGCINITH